MRIHKFTTHVNRDKTKKPLLALLKPGKVVSGEWLASRLNISRQALNKQIAGLRKKGYSIQATQRVGYKLLALPNQLFPELISATLAGQFVGRRIFHFPELDSTQTKAKELASRGHPEGTLVIAEEQTAGRGRMGRSWVSGKGGIWFSLILRPQMSPQNVPLLALTLSLAIAKAIEEKLQVPTGVKWPNDVMAEVPGKGKKFKKICGILTEMSAETERVDWVVTGIGINANNPLPKELQETGVTLSEATGLEIDRVSLLQAVLEKAEAYYCRLMNKGFALLRKEYLAKSILKNQSVTVSNEKERFEGTFSGIGQDGSLILLTRSREQISFHSGDVTHCGKVRAGR